jgi:hypothetical protein
MSNSGSRSASTRSAASRNNRARVIEGLGGAATLRDRAESPAHLNDVVQHLAERWFVLMDVSKGFELPDPGVEAGAWGAYSIESGSFDWERSRDTAAH